MKTLTCVTLANHIPMDKASHISKLRVNIKKGLYQGMDIRRHVHWKPAIKHYTTVTQRVRGRANFDLRFV